MTRRSAPLLVTAAVFTLAGGYVHLREWLDTYRDVPSAAPGSWVVRIGFPIDVAMSVLLAAALLVVALRASRLFWPVLAGAIAAQAGSLVVLIASRRGTVFGWTEPVWNRGAEQARAVEIGALVALGLAAAFRVRRPSRAAHRAQDEKSGWLPRRDSLRPAGSSQSS